MLLWGSYATTSSERPAASSHLRSWADGTRHLLFEPLEFLEKLAALIPRSHVNLVLYHGVLAPHARWRSRVVLPAPADPAPLAIADSPEPLSGTGRARARHWAWAHLMQRAFGVDVLACPRCAGRLRLVATVDDPRAIRAILESLGLPAEVPQPDPPQPPPAEGGGLLANVLS